MHFDPAALSGLRPRAQRGGDAAGGGGRCLADLSSDAGSAPSATRQSLVGPSQPPVSMFSSSFSAPSSAAAPSPPQHAQPHQHQPHQAHQCPSLQHSPQSRYQEACPMPTGNPGGGGFGDIMGSAMASSPAGMQRSSPATRAPLSANLAGGGAMSFSDFNSYPMRGGGAKGPAAAAPGGSFILDASRASAPPSPVGKGVTPDPKP